MPHGIENWPDLSSDKFYRRVHRLQEAGLVEPFRGTSNKLLLTDADSRTFGRFLAMEQDNPKAGLEWCLEHLRYELEHERAEVLQSSLEFSHTEVRQLRYALARVRRNPWARMMRRAKQWGTRIRALLGSSAIAPETNEESSRTDD